LIHHLAEEPQQGHPPVLPQECFPLLSVNQWVPEAERVRTKQEETDNCDKGNKKNSRTKLTSKPA